MINTFVNLSTLSLGDVIIAKKRKGLGRILNHYLVFVGNNRFIGNLKDGVKEIHYDELMNLLNEYEPTGVRKLNGTFLHQQQAINRAYSKLGYRYSLLNFNCEHFANWVQFGRVESSQVTTGFAILAGVLFLKLVSRDE
ncbi:lecithin retinol acyltransferase family protein [Algibacter sp. AS12]|uniref:lecithin retinol acyltransferase family protein n=1 Tax=Algibacter sp. AS12 TaxID=3135773 RepID=UPI00398A5824